MSSTRVVKPDPGAVKAVPVVVPEPKISSFAEVVVAPPLLALAPLPAAAAVTSSGLVGSNPLYSRMRTSGYAAAWLNVTVTVLPPAAMFLA